MPDAPNWATFTPEDTVYSLSMDNGRGGPDQVVEITREEFIMLKDCLARHRGMAPAGKEERN